MNRRWFLQLLGFSGASCTTSGGGDEHIMNCAHSFTKGPFYVTVASSFEEPGFYPPSSLYPVQHCSQCGIIRLPKEVRELNSENIAAGHVKENK